MSNFNSAIMNDVLQKMCVPGEKYRYPVYGVIKNTAFFQTRYNQWLICYAALSDFRRLLFVECDMFSGAPTKFCALSFDDLVSVKIGRRFLGQRKIVMVLNVEGKKKKYTFRMYEKVYNSDFDDQEYNLTQLIAELEKLSPNT